MKVFVIAIAAAVSAPLAAYGTQPIVAIHDSELTRALDSTNAPASGATPTGPGTTGNQWWVTQWHYFVMPDSVKEALRSDGTAFTVVGDSDISAGALTNADGSPQYPILISLASEAVSDDEISQLTNYVAAGGILFIGSSSFTRNPDGTTRTNFAIATALGVNMVSSNLLNWNVNTTFTMQVTNRIVSHIPGPGVSLQWAMPSASEEISLGTYPQYNVKPPHLVWQVQAGDATVIAQGDSYPYLLVKPYGKGYFIYCAAMEPLLGHSGWAPGMYAYVIFRKSIEWAFENARLPVPKLSPWPYPYDAAFMFRHDLENYDDEIAHILDSAEFEYTNGVKGDYYFCTGALRVDMPTNGYDTNLVIGDMQQAVTNFGATIGPHNGGLENPNPCCPELVESDFYYWHWGPDEALDVDPTNLPLPGYASGQAYALTSVSNSFVDIEGWLPGIITNGMRTWVSPMFNATREGSFQIQEQLNVKTSGEQKLSPFPNWTFSTQTPDMYYSFLNIPVSDWYVNTNSQPAEIGQDMEVGQTQASMEALVDFYYSLGALINLYGHTLSASTTTNATGPGAAGPLAAEYVTYGMNSYLHPRLWSVNATGLYGWWVQRSNAQITASSTVAGSVVTTTLSISGAQSTNQAVEFVLPNAAALSGLQVFTNGTLASGNSYRTNGQVVKILVGTTITTATLSYNFAPNAQNDQYTNVAGTTLTVAAPGVLTNDAAGLGGSNLTAVLVGSGPANGTLNLNADGSFSYTPYTGFVGTDSFTYQAVNGALTSSVATVTIIVDPPVPPVANNDNYSIVAGTTLTVGAPGVLANDSAGNGGASLTADLLSEPSNGTLVFPGDGSFSYTPNNGFVGTDTFTYQAVNGSLASSVATVSVTVTTAVSPPWFDRGWTYRQAVVVTNGGSSGLLGYQVQVVLDNSFNFAGASTNGSDVFVTAGDGTTPIPFWIESWDAAAGQGDLWVKVPLLSPGQTTLFIYYGNPAFNNTTPQAVPPMGPFSRAPGNPIIPNGDPGDGQEILAENMIYDNASGHYWLAFSHYQDPYGVGLLWSDTPADPTSWNWGGIVYTNPTGPGSFAPCLVQDNGTNYIFFSDWSNGYFGVQHSLVYITSTSINGPYSAPTTVLSPVAGTWENWRVDEPYVFQRDDGKWIIVYMGDTEPIDGSGLPAEQVGYAYADNITGPYTKYTNNPVLAFGPPGSYDAGTCADPWVYKSGHTYYIGYTSSTNATDPWQTSVATTPDWVTFTKLGVMFPVNSSGWDADNSFRGAVIRLNDSYILAYVGDGYESGIATQAVYQILNSPNAVFDFYDNFPGTNLDGTKWTIMDGDPSQAVVSNGQLTLTANSSSYPLIMSQQAFGMNYMMEAYASHPQSGTLGMDTELGFNDGAFGDLVRITDDFPDSLGTTYWNRQSKLSGQADEANFASMAETADTNWHTFHLYRLSSGVAGFQIDDNAVETVASNVPVSNLPLFLLSYTENYDNEFLVDWVRVRKFASPEPVVSLGNLTYYPSNALPQAISQAVSTVQNSAVSVTLTGSNPGGYPLTYTVVTGPANGVLSGQAPNLIYTPATNYYGPDSFQFTVSDGQFDSTQATVTITVIPVSPVANNDSYSMAAGSTLTVAAPGVLANDSAGSGGGPLTASLVSPPANGTLVSFPGDGSFSYTPDSGFAGTDSFTYQAVNGSLVSSVATVTVIVGSELNPPWYDPAWIYRQVVAVTNGVSEELTNYQVQVVLNSSFNFAGASTNGSDVRVTAGDGTTPIPFWIESWNAGSQQASIWVNMPLLPASATTNIFIYYGNPSAASASDAAAVFDFYDNFPGTSLDGTKWTIANGNSSQVAVANGLLTLTGTSSSFIRIMSQESFGLNYMVEQHAQASQVGILNTVLEAGLVDSTFANAARIMSDYPSDINNWTRESENSGVVTDVSMAESLDTNWHTFHVYRLAGDPNVGGFQIDTNAVETTTDNVSAIALTPFLMSYTQGADLQVISDWVRVRKFVLPEPVAGLTLLAQTINFGSLPDKTYGDAPFTVTATSSSGLPVTFSIVSGPATILGNTITITGAGTVTVRASQAGDINYTPAPDVDQSFTVNQATAELTLTASGITYGQTLAESGLSGSVATNGADGAAVAGGFAFADETIAPYAGSTNVSVIFTPTDAEDYASVTNLVSVTVSKATPSATLAVNNTPVTYNGSGQAATVAVTVSSVPGSVANILTGGAAAQTGVGTYAVTADFVPTDGADYNSLLAQAAGNFVIEKATPSATLAVNNSPVAYDGTPKAATVAITASSVGGTVQNILTGGAATQTSVGTYAVTADFVPGDTADYNSLIGLPAGNFVISQTVPAFTGMSSVTNSYGVTNLILSGALSAAGPVYPANGDVVSASINGFTVSGTVTNNTGGFQINYNDPSLTTNGVSGSPYTITYNYAGNAGVGLSAGNDSSTWLTLTQATAELTLTASGITYGQTLAESGLSGSVATNGADGAAVAGGFAFADETIAPYAGSTNVSVIFTPTDAEDYASVTNLVSVTVSKATPSATLAVNNTPVTYNGSGQAATVAVTVSSVPGSVANILTGGAAAQTGVGTYAVTADFVPTDGADYNSLLAQAAGNFVIEKATPSATLAVNNSPVAYDGTPKAATVAITASSVGGTVQNILTGGAATQTSVGTYAVTADFVPGDTADYNSLIGLPAGNFVISQTVPAFTGMSSVTNSYGVTNLILSGALSAAGPVYPANGDVVSASINGFTVSGTVTNNTGGFQINYNDPSLTTNGVSGSPYTITYNYAGNAGVGLSAGNDSSTWLTLTQATAELTLTASGITYGQTLAESGLSGSVATNGADGAAVAGGFAFADETIAPYAGSTNVSVIFTPTDAEDYASVTNLVSVTVSKATPSATLAVNNTPVTYNGSGQAATVAVTVSSVPGSVANILTGGAAAQTGVGTYAVTADFVPTDGADYNSLLAQAAGNFVIEKATPSATLAVNNSPVAYDGTPKAATVAITASSVGGTVQNILTGGAATQTSVGTYAVTADFVPGDTADYNSLIGLPAGNFVISQTVPAFTGMSSVTNSYGVTNLILSGALSAAGPVYPANGDVVSASINGFTVSGTVTNNTGGFQINYNDPSLTTNGVSGSPYTITYNYAGNAGVGLSAGNDSSTWLTLTQATAELTLTASGITYGQTLAESGLSGSVATNGADGAAVAGGFAFADETIAPYAGSTNVSVIFTPTDAEDYASVTNLVSVTVSKATPSATLAVNNTPVTYNGSGQAATVAVTVSSVPGSVANILTGGAAAQTGVGTYAVTADFVPTDTADYNSLLAQAAGNFVISKAAATIVVTPYNVTYDGTAHTATGTATGVLGENLSSELNLSGTTHTAAGSYPSDSWTFTDTTGNYNNASATVADTINAAQSAIALTSSLNPAPLGTIVTFTATVTSVSSPAITPTGLVEFSTNGVEFDGPVVLSGGTATMSTALLPQGSNTIVAQYLSSGNFFPSADSLVETVTVETPITLGVKNNGDGTVTVTFEGTPGGQYLVQATADLVAMPWSNISTNIAAPDGQWTFTDSVTNHGQRFFRSATP